MVFFYHLTVLGYVRVAALLNMNQIMRDGASTEGIC